MAAEADGGNGERHPPPRPPERPAGFLDHYLGTKEGRARLLFWIWVSSIAFMGIGYALIFVIFIRGGL
ncbi:MAG: hypothetical protein FJ149_04675 [Euryarchaeota archaeon]|nr:hypothetical protein [Euryarchaeota archaeon]